MPANPLFAPPPPPPVKLLLTPREAARALSLCEKSLYLAVRRGELRAVKIGRAVRYSIADLQDFIQQKAARPGQGNAAEGGIGEQP